MSSSAGVSSTTRILGARAGVTVELGAMVRWPLPSARSIPEPAAKCNRWFAISGRPPELQYSSSPTTSTKLFVSVGSKSNNDDGPVEKDRARIFEYAPDGSTGRVFAYGIRNPVGLAIHPETGELWASVNERDALGDDLVPDYVTRVQDGGFYGWPWFYIGGNYDPKHDGKHPELKSKVIVPDVLVQPHSASLGMAFYDGKQFPKEYSGDAFAAEHGSWNHAAGSGHEVIRIPLEKGRASGVYEDFLTGFATNGVLWGRPVGIAVAPDGSMLVTDDGAKVIWRVSYAGK